MSLRVAAVRAAPTEEMKVFLATQIADEARHVRFFDRFYDQVGVLESDNLADRLTRAAPGRWWPGSPPARSAA